MDARTAACYKFPPVVGCAGRGSGAIGGFDPRPQTGLLAIVGTTIWAAHKHSPGLSGFDRSSGHAFRVTPYGASGGATGLATIGQDLWVAYSGGQVARLAAGTTAAQQVAAVATQLSAITADASGVYAASRDGHELFRLDPSSLAVTGRVDVGGRATGVAVAPDGSVWVTISALNG